MASQSSRIYTGLAGLPVVKEPHKELLKLYKKLSRHLTALPEESKYRIVTEQLVKERRDIVESTSDREEIEKKINAGLCEELIEQAKHELHLVQVMKEHKPWEPLEEKPSPNQWKWPL